MSKKEKIENKKIAVKRGISGLGMFALESLEKDEELLEYVGPHVDLKEADRLKNRYLFTINENEFINGAARENKARYFNHACKPNAEAIQNGKRIYIHAKKKIKAGEEITFDYGKEYFNEYLKGDCRCTSCVLKKEKEANSVKEKAAIE